MKKGYTFVLLKPSKMKNIIDYSDKILYQEMLITICNNEYQYNPILIMFLHTEVTELDAINYSLQINLN